MEMTCAPRTTKLVPMRAERAQPHHAKALAARTRRASFISSEPTTIPFRRLELPRPCGPRASPVTSVTSCAKRSIDNCIYMYVLVTHDVCASNVCESVCACWGRAMLRGAAPSRLSVISFKSLSEWPRTREAPVVHTCAPRQL